MRWIACLTFVVVACNSTTQQPPPKADPDEAAKLVARKVEADRAEQEARERAKLLASPNEFLETSDPQVFDKGIVNSYRTLTAITVLNRSHFPVAQISGDAFWLAENGQRFGSMPVSLKGTLLPGESKTFRADNGTLQNGTIQAPARNVAVVLSHVEITLP